MRSHTPQPGLSAGVGSNFPYEISNFGLRARNAIAQSISYCSNRSYTYIANMPTSFASTYVVPALLLNPCIILHFFNTLISRFDSGDLGASTSPHQWLEQLGPKAHSDPYFDIHKNDQLCWGYTLIMVVVQLLAFGKVSDNRVQRKAARAARKERERLRRIGVEEGTKIPGAEPMGKGQATGLDGTCDVPINGNASRPHMTSRHSVPSIVDARLHDSTEETGESTSEEEILL